MRKLLARALRATSSRHRPLQIAVAILLGMIAGGVASNPLLGLIVLAVAFVLPIHLPVAFATAACCAFITLAAAPLVGDLGAQSLTHPQLAEFWLRVDSYPLVPWLGLHNTVVQGGLVWGAAAGLLLGAVSLPLTYWIFAAAPLPAASLAAQQSNSEPVIAEPLSENLAAAEPSAAGMSEQIAAAPAAPVDNQSVQPNFIEVEDDDSFAALSADELRLLDKLDNEQRQDSTGTSQPSTLDYSDHKQRIDSPAAELPSPPHRSDRSAATSHDFELPEELQGGQPEQSTPPALQAFDAVGRLEELLSGCRVQPHWIDAESEAASTVQDDNADGAEEEPSRSIELSSEAEVQETESTGDGADAQTVLQRSAEIAGLVDHLLASLDDLDTETPAAVEHTDWSDSSSHRHDLAHQPVATSPHVDPADKTQSAPEQRQPVAETEATNGRDSDDDRDLRSEPDDGPVVLKLDDQSTLRFDQIDISETFAKPLYQPHSSKAAEKQPVGTEQSAEAEHIAAASLETDNATAAPRTGDGLQADKQGATDKQISVAGKTDSDESLIEVVQRGHDEALRHLLHHLREIEERVRK